MLFSRCLVLLASGLLTISGVLLEVSPRDAAVDACHWIERLSSPCPSWVSEQNIPPISPWVCFALACLGLLFVVCSLLKGVFDRPPESVLAEFIQRGRDLHERCRKEGDQAVIPEIDAWTGEVSRFLRRLGHRYIELFSDFRGMQLFASQYDTAASLEIRQRIQRLNEFMLKFPAGRPQRG
ncbi:MAG TPA: hypothetical protein VIX87_02400 [Steroidobacteraceae bacterium]